MAASLDNRTFVIDAREFHPSFLPQLCLTTAKWKALHHPFIPAHEKKYTAGDYPTTNYGVLRAEPL